MIVRQSSLSTAVALLKTDKKAASVDEVILTARQFEAYVMGTTPPVVVDPSDPFGNMEDDVPL